MQNFDKDCDNSSVQRVTSVAGVFLRLIFSINSENCIKLDNLNGTTVGEMIYSGKQLFSNPILDV